MLQSIVQKLRLENLPVELLMKPSTDTHILIADSHSGDFSQLLQTAKAVPVRIFFSKQVVQAKNTISVAKPPQPKQLYEIIKKVLAKLMAMEIQHKRPVRAATATAPANAAPPVLTTQPTTAKTAAASVRSPRHEAPPARPVVAPSSAPAADAVTESDVVETPKINTEHYFALIYRAKRDKKCLRVKSNSGITLFINGANKTIWQKAPSNFDMDQLLTSKPEDLNVNTIHEITAEPEGQIIALDNLLWQSAIVCSKGKILDGHVMDQPITLKAWPNFTRQSFDPMHLKMSALLAKESMSLNQLSSLCQIPIEQVINFYNAAFAVDLIERRNKPREDSEIKRKSTPVLKDMLSRLAKKLKIQ